MATFNIIRSKKAISFLLNQRNFRAMPSHMTDKRFITSEDVAKINEMIRKKREKTAT